MKLIEYIVFITLAVSCICFAVIAVGAPPRVLVTGAIWLACLLVASFISAFIWHRKVDKPLRNIGCAVTLKENKSGTIKAFHEIKDLTELEATILPLLSDDIPEPAQDFLAEMTHEIKTPLNGVIGFISNLQDTPLNQQQKQFLKIISSSANSLMYVMNQILDYSKINAGKLELEDIAFDLKALLQDRCAIAEQIARSKNIKVYLVFPYDQPLVVRGDPNRLRQVLDNLLTNAVKFTHAGEICLEANANAIADRPDILSISFAVRDTGVGMSQKTLDSLFKPYRQADSSVARNYGGTGLGLCISASLVKLMGGKLNVRSVPQQGSTFFFNLSLARAKAVEQVRLTGPFTVKLPKSELRKNRALLVDDTPTNLFLLETVCQNAGLPYRTASNGQEAVDLAVMHKFDVVFMDIQMPVMDGYTAIRKLRSLPNTASSHIVALTASAYQEDIERALEAGATEFIPKPFEKNQLLMSIADALAITPEKIFASNDINPESEDDETIRHMHDFLREQYQMSLGEIKMTLAQTLVDWRPLLDNLKAYVKSGNIDQARQIFHKLKGQLASIGLLADANTASLINEALADSEDSQAVMQQTDDFIKRLSRIFKNLEQDITIA